MLFDSRAFVEAMRTCAIDSPATGLAEVLRSLPGRSPSKGLRRLSTWFNGLTQADQAMVLDVIRLSAHESLFGVLAALDGVRAIDSEGGGLELHYVSGDLRRQLNPPSGEALHDILNEQMPYEV